MSAVYIVLERSYTGFPASFVTLNGLPACSLANRQAISIVAEPGTHNINIHHGIRLVLNHDITTTAGRAYHVLIRRSLWLTLYVKLVDIAVRDALSRPPVETFPLIDELLRNRDLSNCHEAVLCAVLQEQSKSKDDVYSRAKRRLEDVSRLQEENCEDVKKIIPSNPFTFIGDSYPHTPAGGRAYRRDLERDVAHIRSHPAPPRYSLIHTNLRRYKESRALLIQKDVFNYLLGEMRRTNNSALSVFSEFKRGVPSSQCVPAEVRREIESIFQSHPMPSNDSWSFNAITKALQLPYMGETQRRIHVSKRCNLTEAMALGCRPPTQGFELLHEGVFYHSVSTRIEATDNHENRHDYDQTEFSVYARLGPDEFFVLKGCVWMKV